MYDDTFTPALLAFGLVFSLALAWGELVCLHRSWRFLGWRTLLPPGLVNTVFFYILAASLNSYSALFIFPLPVIPTAFLLVKSLAIRPRPGFVPLLLSTVVTLILFGIGYAQFAPFNPARSNLQQAIRDNHHGQFTFMVWLSVKSEPNMTILMNEALLYGNASAVQSLICLGADPHGAYRLRESTREVQWLLVK